jgi:hypothetical protein
VKRAVFRHRVPMSPRVCYDCQQAIVDGPPYERIEACWSHPDGDTDIVSHNLCTHCWKIHCWITKDDGLEEVA